MYDVIVLGSGLGGLVCAAILSKEGKKVLVIEKNNQLGGNLQCFVRDKQIFDTGVHYLGGLLPGQNLHTYFKYLGIVDDLELERMDMLAFDQIRLGNDPQNYPFAQGKENFIAELAKIFPQEKTGLQALLNRMEDCCKRFPLFQIDGHRKYTIHQDDLEKSVAEVIRYYIKAPKLQSILLGTQMLYAGDPEKTPFYVHALSVFSYIQSAWKCKVGGSQIAKLLARQIFLHGGEIIKYDEVRAILTGTEGLATGVETKSGKTILSKIFISNINPKKTLELVKGFSMRKSYQERIQRRQETISSFSVFLILKPGSVPYRKQNLYYTEDDELAWPNRFMLSMTPSRQNPAWAESLTVFTYMPFEDVQKWSLSVNTVANKQSRPKEYEDFKMEKSTIFIQKIMEILPELEGNIMKHYAASPLSYRDYIGNEKGEIYGFKKEIDQPHQNFNPSQTKIKNLFQTGQHQNMHGILGVTISAVMTCGELLGSSYLLDKIASFRTEGTITEE